MFGSQHLGLCQIDGHIKLFKDDMEPLPIRVMSSGKTGDTGPMFYHLTVKFVKYPGQTCFKKACKTTFYRKLNGETDVTSSFGEESQVNYNQFCIGHKTAQQCTLPVDALGLQENTDWVNMQGHNSWK